MLNPEALYGNLIAQLACVPEAMLTSTTLLFLLTPSFGVWAQGSAYPLTGTTNYRDTPIQVVRYHERLNYKLHRQGMITETRGEDGAICHQYPTPILPKSRYRYQMTGPIPDAACVTPTTTTTIWESGYDNPVTGDNLVLPMA